MTAGIKANVDGSAAIQVGGTDVITLTSGGAATFVTSPTTVQAGTAAAPSITFSGDTNTGIYSPGADTIAFTEGGVESARFDSSGNFLINATTNSLNARVRIATATRTANFFDLTATGGENWVINSTNTTGSTDVLGIYANGATGLYIQDTGNVGIGTSSPAVTFHAANTGGGGMSGANPSGEVSRLQQTPSAGSGGYVVQRLFLNKTSTANDGASLSFEGLAAGGDRYALANIGGYISSAGTGNAVSGHFAIFTKPANGDITERARITSDGNLLIGTTTNTARITAINTTATARILQMTKGDTSDFFIVADSSSVNRFLVSGSGQITSNTLAGGATTLSVDAGAAIIRTPSDASLKTNIQPIQYGLETVLKLKPVSHEWVEEINMGGASIGFIAQDMEQEIPEVVSGVEYKSIDYPKLVAVLTKAIQEQQTMIDELKAKVAALEGA